jgi:hypothetical protein
VPYINRYYSLSFGYLGPKSTILDHSKEASAALNEAITIVGTTLKKKGFDVRTEYAWPDGSLYFYLRVLGAALGPVACSIEEAMAEHVAKVRLISIAELNPDDQRLNDCTVKELFEKTKEEKTDEPSQVR